jgi:hypothetical protein
MNQRRSFPDLPKCTVGVPPGRPPGATRPPPRLGGVRGMSVPPEIRRRTPGAVRAAPGADVVTERMRLALCKAQRKLLNAHAKLQSSATLLRAKLISTGGNRDEGPRSTIR